MADCFASLKNEYPDLSVLLYDSIDSTNSDAKRRKEIKRGVILARCQTAGRGRQGRSFYSPENTGLYMSVIIPITPLKALEFSLTALAAVASARAIEEFCGISTDIKWVNDLYLNGKKICGILAEADVDRVIVGIGINLSTSDFPSDLPLAGSLNAPDVSSEALGERIARELFSATEKKDSSFMDEYRRRSMLTGKEITFEKDGELHIAKAVDIDAHGGLIICENGEKSTLSSGEVHILMN